ncbi:glycosyltransferase [Rhizobium grahamii]|uniref:Glycosyltransferase n=2 Tax=Rhizobium grahamii TaxID=1120045 RepID=S3HTF5_9HYPH|nr:glycosyltransferase [Rhizobium grahamii]EPE96496.1 glycosyltransferase [Rhizobium grahamii CCGE 502]RDJ03291.1 glycosyl transferase [Rhizobium grahamii]
MTAPFVINGRFLTQNVTGVQRYARNVVSAMDAFDRAHQPVVFAPAATENPGYSRLGFIAKGALKGHGWEQLDLPRLLGARRLLNLCNTGPAIKSDQIVCIHDANIFAAPESYSQAFRAVYHNLQPILARRSARIATVSHAAARQIARHLPVSLSSIAILPNGHEHALSWDPGRATSAPELLVSRNHRPYVLVLGSRARHKNVSLLMEIASDLDQLGVDIVIAGGGDGVFTTEALEGKANVQLSGRVSDDDLAYLLDHALCLAFPSLTEGFGLPILEAMARGCPVISSNSASMPEVCGNAALLASPFDASQWIDHIRLLLQSKDLRDDLAGRGLENVRRFSWKQTAEGYLDLLETPAASLASHQPPESPAPRIAAVFATRGRPEVVAATVRHFLATQSLQPSSIIISCVDTADAGSLASLPDITIVTGPPGLAAQRNTALEHLEPDTEIVAFFDDDFVADQNWLAAAARVFRDESQVVSFTGHVVADGIKGPGISFDEAVRAVEAAPVPTSAWTEHYSPYGCNMAFRVAAIGNVRFDERLVLYGWLEDRDFAAALGRRGGRSIKWSGAYGVHMGVKSGRVSGERLGYSQVINPLYMRGKGTMSFIEVADHVFRNTASNFGRALCPEPFIDRKGRAKGNLLALLDVLRGRLEPERAAEIGSRNITHTPGWRQETR